jgi:putative IMPACT (imprinted ancient) family translation regulator
VLLHSGIGEIAAVVTRWYGGIKLGTGGLVKAYGGAVQEALASLQTVERVDTVDVKFGVPYAQVGGVLQALPTVPAEVLAQEFGVDASFVVRVPREQIPHLRSVLQDLTRGTTHLEECAHES